MRPILPVVDRCGESAAEKPTTLTLGRDRHASEGVEPRVLPVPVQLAALYQFLVPARLGHLSIVQHHDPVRTPNG